MHRLYSVCAAAVLGTVPALLLSLPARAQEQYQFESDLVAKRRFIATWAPVFAPYAADRMETITSSPRLLRPCRFTMRRGSASVKFPVNPQRRPKARRWYTANRSMWIARAASSCAIAARTPSKFMRRTALWPPRFRFPRRYPLCFFPGRSGRFQSEC